MLFRLIQARSPEMPLRVWVSGCSTGEEVYSIAISLLECSRDTAPNRRVQLFATDVDEASIAKARAGQYPEDVARAVSPERLRRYEGLLLLGDSESIGRFGSLFRPVDEQSKFYVKTSVNRYDGTRINGAEGS